MDEYSLPLKPDTWWNSASDFTDLSRDFISSHTYKVYRHKLLSSNKAPIYLNAFDACDAGVLNAWPESDGMVDVMTPRSSS